MAGKPSPIEAEELIAAIPRGEHSELRVRFVKLVSGVELYDVRLWRKTWRGHVPGKGVALRVDEAMPVAAALKKGPNK